MNRFVCQEGIMNFDEEVIVQTVNIIAFRQGAHITVNRDRLPDGQTLSENITAQFDKLRSMLHDFTLTKIHEHTRNPSFNHAIEAVFITVNQAGQKTWHVSWSVLLADRQVINFSSVYADEATMKRESPVLRQCVENFEPSAKV